MGKRKVISESDIGKPVLPQANEVLGIAEKLLGYDRITVRCQNGAMRLCRIMEKMKRRVWIRPNDVVLISPWNVQTDSRGDIMFRYKSGQAEWLRSNGFLKI